MAVKSAYRQKPAAKIPAEPSNIADIKIDGQEPEASVGISAELPEGPKPTDAIVAAVEAAAAADESKYALLKQIEAIRQSEQAQRQAAMMARAHRPMTRDQKLDLWEQQGMPKEERRFFEENPQLVE